MTAAAFSEAAAAAAAAAAASPAEPPRRSVAPSEQQQHPKYATLLLDMDGVLADVSKSYRVAIEKTCRLYGATSVTQDVISEWKVRGNANCDWTLSHNLIRDDPNGDRTATFEQVKQTFEDLYQGTTSTVPGLYRLETLIPTRETLRELKRRSRGGIGVVTGRPRSDCDAFLRDHRLTDLVDACVCAEDGPNKPDPFPVLRCCQLLHVEPGPQVVLVGDTPDDVRAAIAAGCGAVGVLTPEAMAAASTASTGADGDGGGDDLERAVAASPLARAMQQAGVGPIFRPGFEELVGMFPPPPNEEEGEGEGGPPPPPVPGGT